MPRPARSAERGALEPLETSRRSARTWSSARRQCPCRRTAREPPYRSPARCRHSRHSRAPGLATFQSARLIVRLLAPRGHRKDRCHLGAARASSARSASTRRHARHRKRRRVPTSRHRGQKCAPSSEWTTTHSSALVAAPPPEKRVDLFRRCGHGRAVRDPRSAGDDRRGRIRTRAAATNAARQRSRLSRRSDIERISPS